MKIALYIKDGLEQIVLTPETDREKTILEGLNDESRTLEIRRGEFYGVRGGWTRWKTPETYFDGPRGGDVSTMIVLRLKESA